MATLLLFDATRLRQARNHLGAGRFDTDVTTGIAVGLALTVMATLLMRRPKGRAGIVALTIVVVLWLIALGWTHPRYHDTGLSSPTDVVLAVASDIPLVLLGALMVVIALAGPGSVRRLVPQTRARTELPSESPREHKAEVWHVIDTKKPASFDPYFIAHCSCDWVGAARTGADAEQQAFDDARSHSPVVAANVSRPLG